MRTKVECFFSATYNKVYETRHLRYIDGICDFEFGDGAASVRDQILGMLELGQGLRRHEVVNFHMVSFNTLVAPVDSTPKEAPREATEAPSVDPVPYLRPAPTELKEWPTAKAAVGVNGREYHQLRHIRLLTAVDSATTELNKHRSKLPCAQRFWEPKAVFKTRVENWLCVDVNLRLRLASAAKHLGENIETFPDLFDSVEVGRHVRAAVALSNSSAKLDH